MLAIIDYQMGNLIDASDEECAREYVQILLHGITATPEGAV